MILCQGPYSQHYIFCITYECPTNIVLLYTSLERPATDKHSSLLGPVMSYEENDTAQETFLQN